MPHSIALREIAVHVNQPGFRTASLVVVTTLTDAEAYRRDEIAELYHRRWRVELDLRAIKDTMGMDILRGQPPRSQRGSTGMVHRELWTCLLAYNLIRRVAIPAGIDMRQSARESGQSPRQLSFTTALQSVAASWLVIVALDDPAIAYVIEVTLKNLARHTVGNRPGRVEPRAVKRRPKPHALLTKPRAPARAELLESKSS